MHLLTSCFRATYRAETPFVMPHDFGGVVAAVVARALLRVGCATRPACGGVCADPVHCSVGRLLAPPLPRSGGHPLLRGRTSPISPLLPLVPEPRRFVVPAGATFDVGLRVMGPLPDGEAALLVHAFETVPNLDQGPDLGRVTLMSLTSDGLRNAPILLATESAPSRRVEVTFITPAWIEEDAKVDPALEFRTLFRAIYRRLGVVAVLFGELDDDFEGAFDALDHAAESVRVTERVTRIARWQRRDLARGVRVPRMGILGVVRFEGTLAPFVPYLRAAELLHVGKLAGEGLGRLRCAFA